MQVLPRISVSKHAPDGTKHAFLLKVSNPTLGTIRMRLASSEYLGEPVWGDQSSSTALLQKILVDPFTDEYLNAELDSNEVKDLEPTEVCTLEPAEDSFLELGTTANEIPESVSQWNGKQVLAESNASSGGTASSLKFLASKSSTGWFELVVLVGASSEGVDRAVPLAMQIEVGNGSWESSLVQPEIAGDSGNSSDMVTFNLVIAWES